MDILLILHTYVNVIMILVIPFLPSYNGNMSPMHSQMLPKLVVLHQYLVFGVTMLGSSIAEITKPLMPVM